MAFIRYMFALRVTAQAVEGDLFSCMVDLEQAVHFNDIHIHSDIGIRNRIKVPSMNDMAVCPGSGPAGTGKYKILCRKGF